MRLFAIVWFGASVFVAPVFLLASVVGVIWTRTGSARREHTQAFAVLGVLGLLLLAGFPVWMTRYAQ